MLQVQEHRKRPSIVDAVVPVDEWLQIVQSTTRSIALSRANVTSLWKISSVISLIVQSKFVTNLCARAIVADLASAGVGGINAR